MLHLFNVEHDSYPRLHWSALFQIKSPLAFQWTKILNKIFIIKHLKDSRVGYLKCCFRHLFSSFTQLMMLWCLISEQGKLSCIIVVRNTQLFSADLMDCSAATLSFVDFHVNHMQQLPEKFGITSPIRYHIKPVWKCFTLAQPQTWSSGRNILDMKLVSFWLQVVLCQYLEWC